MTLSAPVTLTQPRARSSLTKLSTSTTVQSYDLWSRLCYDRKLGVLYLFVSTRSAHAPFVPYYRTPCSSNCRLFSSAAAIRGDTRRHIGEFGEAPPNARSGAARTAVLRRSVQLAARCRETGGGHGAPSGHPFTLGRQRAPDGGADKCQPTRNHLAEHPGGRTRGKPPQRTCAREGRAWARAQRDGVTGATSCPKTTVDSLANQFMSQFHASV